LRRLGSGEPVVMTEREDYDELADELDREADRLASHSEQLGEQIDDVRGDWERKRADGAVPGAPPRQEQPDSQEPGG
jgi:hypothetical protein